MIWCDSGRIYCWLNSSMPKSSILGKYTFEGGYHPNQPAIGRPNGTFVAGEKVWVVPGGRTEAGKDITQISATNVQAVVQEIDTQRGYLPAGNLVRYPGGALFGISEIANAPVFLDEVAAFNLSANAGELTVARESGGTWTAIPAGLPTPTLSTVAATSGGTKEMAGDYSVRIARKRSWDEAYSGWSEAITVTIAAGEQVRVTFPAADSASEQDQWVIAASKKAQNVTGPWYEVFDATEIEESALPGGRTYDIEWHDSDLKVLIATDVQAAPPGRFLFFLDNILHLVASGGSATQPDSRIWPMLPNNPTMTRRSARTITANGHTIVGVLGGQDVALLMCKQSLQIATPTGRTSGSPTTCRQRWDFGFYDQHAGVVVEGYFYGWSGKRLARVSIAELRETSSRENATAATEFTRPVESLLRTFSAENIVVGVDPVRNAVIVFHRNIVAGTTTAVPFMHRDGVWSSPWTIQGLVYSAADVGGQLVITVLSGGNYRGHTWNTNSTLGTMPYLSAVWCDAEAERYDKQITHVDITANAAQAGLHIAERGTAKPPVSGAPTGARIWNLSGTDAVQSTRRLNITNVALFAPYVSFSAAGQFLDEFTVSGDVVRLER